jgi:hypothetical protein
VYVSVIIGVQMVPLLSSDMQTAAPRPTPYKLRQPCDQNVGREGPPNGCWCRKCPSHPAGNSLAMNSHHLRRSWDRQSSLLLETVQIHCEDTNDTAEEFQRRFPVGMWLDISTTTDITAQPEESSPQNDGDEQDGKPRGFVQ